MTRIGASQRSIACILSTALLSACGGGVELGRIGKPVALPTGRPENACEGDAWYELAPARVQAQGSVNNGLFVTSYVRNYEAFGVFEHDADQPEALDDLWSEMNEPELQATHEARIQPVDDAYMRSLYWSLGSVVVMFGGLGTAAAIQDDSPTGAAVFGIGGLTLGLVGAIVAIASQPSGHDQVEANARRQLLIPGEDDMRAAMRGVNRVNGTQRHRCGGPAPERYEPDDGSVPGLHDKHVDADKAEPTPTAADAAASTPTTQSTTDAVAGPASDATTPLPAVPPPPPQ